MNTNATGSIIPLSTLFFFVNVFRSVGQVGKMEFDGIGQRATLLTIFAQEKKERGNGGGGEILLNFFL